ncbi:muramoyltetrapeptide carboxypeptidase LdcA involved in peptidoglycan recycling [Aureibacillus halotolerans]|uniref:Muramoyltetrapeptide carboxypeptidase LdcA involved in peptidoglycan recycling n=2 Tax=Aureibacillus halotolerans TaxID=1508390 RepID=A0A4R6U8N1_9BACI|nr:muramoyltetrapeptide carboxypeptidase LdcA involved in peptidoglycan recycling [Aureibacillus halotolerans]
MQYPSLKENATIGVTAPSSGVPQALHQLLKDAEKRLTKEGYSLSFGDTVWTQEKAMSAPARQRALELQKMMESDHIDLIIPPWGGERLVEILEHLRFEDMKAKWILGYSDTSSLLLALTLKTGIATAHGVNLVDLRGQYWDETTGKWEAVLSTKGNESIRQYSSVKYQSEWDHENPTPCVYHLDQPTEWKTVSRSKETIQGRLLGGCIDIIRHLVGTPYGDVKHFQNEMIHGEPLVWFFENCELNTTDLRRSLVQMKLAGWFAHCSGVLFGRSSANQSVGGYTAEDVYQELAAELDVPIAYDIDFGHVPPQLTLINGARAEVEVNEGKGTVVQRFVP